MMAPVARPKPKPPHPQPPQPPCQPPQPRHWTDSNIGAAASLIGREPALNGVAPAELAKATTVAAAIARSTALVSGFIVISLKAVRYRNIEAAGPTEPSCLRELRKAAPSVRPLPQLSRSCSALFKLHARRSRPRRSFAHRRISFLIWVKLRGCSLRPKG